MSDSNEDDISFHERVEQLRKQKRSTPESNTSNPVVEELVTRAKSQTVTADRLLGEERYFQDVTPFLEEGEQPQFLFPLTRGLFADSPLVVESGAEREELLKKTDGGSVVVTNHYVRVAASKGEWTIPFNSITSVDFVGHPALHIQTPGRTYYIKIAGTYFDEDENLSEAASYIRKKQRETTERDATTESNPVEKLEKLGELREKGVISKEEFQEKKTDLMDEI